LSVVTDKLGWSYCYHMFFTALVRTYVRLHPLNIEYHLSFA